MRPQNPLAGLSLLCALTLGCGETFCDAYPEACGGASPATFDIEVSLIGENGEEVAAVPVLVSDLAGKVIGVKVGGQGAPIEVPDDSYISVFHDGAGRRVFTALATRDTPKLRFQLPVVAVANAPNDVEVTASCGGNCPGDTQLTVSCRVPLDMTTDATNAQAVLSDYTGCDSSLDFDAYMVTYDLSGGPLRASTMGGKVTSPTLTLPTAILLTPEEILDFEMTLQGGIDFAGVTRTVRVPYIDRPGYGFSRSSADTDTTIQLPLVSAFVPRAQTLFAVALADERSLWRQQRFETVPAEAFFDTSELAIPSVSPQLQQDDPSQPQAYYSLDDDDGRLGDALQLVVEQGTLTWVVTIPAEVQGSFSFPVLPESFSSYLLADEDNYDVLHLDLDDVNGYAALTSKPILDFAAETGTDDLTIARSSR